MANQHAWAQIVAPLDAQTGTPIFILNVCYNLVGIIRLVNNNNAWISAKQGKRDFKHKPI